VYLPEMLVELSLKGFHRHCRVPGQPRPANRKVFVATGALTVQPRFVVLGDLKMWLFHASSMAQSRTGVREQIRRTVIHELGHYFGMDESQLKDV